MSNKNKIYRESEILIAKLASLLKEGYELFPKVLIPTNLLLQGLTSHKGIIVKLDDVAHKYLYEGYEDPFLRAYISLFEKIFSEKTATTNEFSFRALLEMGVEDSFILFDPRVDEKDKKLYTLLILLADYSSIETSMKGMFHDWFNKLFKNNEDFLKGTLSDKDLQVILDLKHTINQTSINEDVFTSLLKYSRQLINKHKSNILNKYAQKKIFELTKTYKRMKSGESHTLHGNVFLIAYRMGQQSVDNHLFRVHAYLTISGNALLTKLSEYHKNDKYTGKVNGYIKEYDLFKAKFTESWANSK